MVDDRRSTPEGDGSDEYPDELNDDVCATCDGTGGDPLNDYALPCPECGQ